MSPTIKTNQHTNTMQMTIIVPRTVEGLTKGLRKLDVDYEVIERFTGYDYTGLLCYMLMEAPEEADVSDPEHRTDIKMGPIQEFDPRTGRIVVGLEEGGDVEMFPHEYATREEVNKYVTSWRCNLSAMDRILEEDYPELEAEVDEGDDNTYVITYRKA